MQPTNCRTQAYNTVICRNAKSERGSSKWTESGPLQIEWGMEDNSANALTGERPKAMHE